MNGGIDKLLHQRLDNLITRQLYIEYGTTLVDVLNRELATTLIGILRQVADMINQTALEIAAQYLVLVLNKHAYTLILEFANHAGSQIYNLFVIIIYTFLNNAVLDTGLGLLVEESQQQLHGVGVRNNFKFVGILKVHNLVADIVGCLNKIHQRMTGVTQGLAHF